MMILIITNSIVLGVQAGESYILEPIWYLIFIDLEINFFVQK